MAKTEIVEVKSKKQLRKFIDFPNQLYKDEPNYIPHINFDEYNTLHWKKNPAFEHCEAKYWLAYQNEKIVGRIAGIINHNYISKWKNNYARFGWVDYINDLDVSKALFDAVEDWAKSKNLDGVHGPLGFTDLDPEGMLIEGFDKPGSLITIYNFPYYADHIRKYGYKKDVNWLEFKFDLIPNKIDEDVLRVANFAEKRYGFTFKRITSKKELLSYAQEIFDLLDKAYANLYGVTPLTKKQVDTYIKAYFSFVIPDLIPVVFDKEGKLAGFGVGVPSLNKALIKNKGRILPFGFINLLRELKKSKILDLYLIGVQPQYVNKGVNALLLKYSYQIAIEMGYTKAIATDMLESNTKVWTQWQYFGAQRIKKRTCFLKKLEE